MLATIKETLKGSFSLRGDVATPEEIAKDIAAGAEVKGTNMWILMLAILIASIGLNMNSTAVIIGAMLISPLMGGIMAIGYGIAINDLNASKKAFVGLLFQVIICILTSTVYFSLSPISDAHSEILARTSPSIWDVLIAIFGGLAGIIGITRKERSNVIPGVAIATALMPPLCTAGFGLATHNLRYFLGAMYLFFINSFFICITTIVILKFLKLPCKEFIDKKAKQKLYAKVTVLAVITIIPSIFLAYQLISDTVTHNNVKQFLQKEVQYSDTQVVQSNLNEKEHVLEIALLGKQLTAHEIEHLQSLLPEYGLQNLSLKITQPNLEGVITADDLQAYMDSSNKDTENKIALALKDNEIATLKEKLEAAEAAVGDYKKQEYPMQEMKEELAVLYPQILDFSVGMQKSAATSAEENADTLLVILKSNKKLTTSEREKLENWFKAKTNTESVTLLCEVVKA